VELRAALPSPLRRRAYILAVLSIVSVVGCSLATGSDRPAEPSAASDRTATRVQVPDLRGTETSPEPLPTAGAGEPAAGIVPATGIVPAAVPSFSHVYLIVMENHEYGSIVGSTHAPYINSLIRRYGLATNDHAVAHPS